MSLLKVRNLGAGYRGVAVVRGLDLNVGEQEIVALLGANGAGKTTTLLTLSGLLDPLGGEIVFAGSSIYRQRADAIARRGLVQVPEDRALFGQLTVAENLRAAAKSRTALRDAVAYFPALDRLMGRRAALLSGGEQQMLALARAIAVHPRLLLVDEMSLGLAPIIVQSLVPVLRAFVERTGGAVLVVEQHVHIALELADRAYVMSRGEIVHHGTAAQIASSIDDLTGSYLGQSSSRDAGPGAQPGQAARPVCRP